MLIQIASESGSGAGGPLTSLSAGEVVIPGDEVTSVCQILHRGGTGYLVGETGPHAEAH